MGSSVSKIMNKLFANREMRILMLGLDAAGKTSNPQFEKFPTDNSNSVQTQIESTVCFPFVEYADNA
jgi:hypothetical protein